MDQVGFEPTSSRVVGEVTLSFTTSNFVAFRQIRAGRKIEQSSGTTVPRRFTDEVTLLRTIPAGPMGTIGSRLLFELLTRRLFDAASLRLPRALSFVEVTRTFATPVLFVAGIIGTRHLQCSATELRRLSPPVGIEPTTLGLAM